VVLSLKKTQGQLCLCLLYKYIIPYSTVKPRHFSGVVFRLRAGRQGFDFRLKLRRDFFFFYFCHCVQTGSRACSASYPVGNRGSCLGVKLPRREANHSPPCGVEVKNAWSYISTPPCAFMAGYLFKHRDNLDVCLTFVYECFKYLENFKYLESIV